MLNKFKISLKKCLEIMISYQTLRTTLKVTILLALTTSSKISALHILDLNHVIKKIEHYEFRFHKLCKSWRRGESPPSLKIYSFPSDKALCVVAALDCYIERSSVWREKKSNLTIIS